MRVCEQRTVNREWGRGRRAEEEAECVAQLVGEHLESGGESALSRRNPRDGDSARRRLHERRGHANSDRIQHTQSASVQQSGNR